MSESESLWERSCRVIPGGVNSPVRAWKAVGGEPRFLARGSGSRVIDEEGREYIDYVASWGPLILGHAHPAVVEAVEEAARKGTTFGAPTRKEAELAERIVAAVPSVDSVRLVSSGTEATMSALRLARGATGRDRVIKFDGCYHGHGDSFLVAAGSGALTLGVPDSPGVPGPLAELTLVAPYNDLGAVESFFAEYPQEIAAVIVEPVAGNMGCVPPAEGFLEGLRALTSRYGSVLIFDEVITGFRLQMGGAQERYGVYPDLTTMGKVLGGGLPLGAYGGTTNLMSQLAPEGPVYQAGTLSGNPLAVAAGLATLKELEARDPYEEISSKTARLVDGWLQAAHAAQIPATANRVGSLFTLFFHDAPITCLAEAQVAVSDRFVDWFQGMLESGVWLAPSGFECGFVGTAHSEEDIDRSVEIAHRLLGNLGG
ncbi:MAG: glutamate-1-semialdehyde 2,1-aminomutase [Planctomycetota bacterium]|nr:glutamate-1-semialdehyde 2,1-aminomutase [Planctomycetota bacterium]